MAFTQTIDSVAKSKILQEAVKTVMLDMAIEVTQEDNTDSPSIAVYNKRIALANDVIQYPDKYIYQATRLICYNDASLEANWFANVDYLRTWNDSANNVFKVKSQFLWGFFTRATIWLQMWDTLAWVVFADYL